MLKVKSVLKLCFGKCVHVVSNHIATGSSCVVLRIPGIMPVVGSP